jgi:hypothetical protein
MIKNWEDVDGFFLLNDVLAYQDIVSRYTNANFVEIGCWKGRSFSSVIDILIRNSYNNIYVVDHWRHDEIDLFQTFSNNLKELGFEDKYQAIIQDSVPASTLFDNNYFDVIFLDADHRYEGFKNDVLSWYPKLKSGGTICGHDYGCDGVNRVIQEIFGEQYIVPYESMVWMYTKP